MDFLLLDAYPIGRETRAGMTFGECRFLDKETSHLGPFSSGFQVDRLTLSGQGGDPAKQNASRRVAELLPGQQRPLPKNDHG
jgi:hypothetical protein